MTVSASTSTLSKHFPGRQLGPFALIALSNSIGALLLPKISGKINYKERYFSFILLLFYYSYYLCFQLIYSHDSCTIRLLDGKKWLQSVITRPGGSHLIEYSSWLLLRT